jgi:hypothetical protein
MKFVILLLALAFVACQACDGPSCGTGGCCPEKDYVCCGDDLYCAASKDKCPGATAEHIKKLQVAPTIAQVRLVHLQFVLFSRDSLLV